MLSGAVNLERDSEMAKAASKLSFLANLLTQTGDVILTDKDKSGLVCILDDVRKVCDIGEAA